MRINVFIVNIDTSKAARERKEIKKFNVQECKSELDDLRLYGNDQMNLHSIRLFVMRKDKHYDIIQNKKYQYYDVESLMKGDKEFYTFYKRYQKCQD